MALSALGIDVMLPAFGDIREGFGLSPDSTAVARIVTAYFLGLAIGQAFYGPFADRFGRKPVLYVGFSIYAAGALSATFAPSLGLLLFFRFVWGLGAAGSRVVVLSMVRDTWSGERMARAMSFIMAIFVLVPVAAPSLGAAIVSVLDWRWVFAFCAVYVTVMAVWARRLPETLHPEFRIDRLRLDWVTRAARLVLTNRVTMGYTLALTALFGVFTSYLASSEIIFSETFGRGDQFPVIFGVLAAFMGVAMLTNGAVVSRFGVRRLVHGVLFAYVGAAGALAFFVVSHEGRPPFLPFTVGLGLMLVMHALLLPNVNTVAMDPMDEVAGTAAAVIGTISTAFGALFGSMLDGAFDGTATPISLGFVVFGVAALLLVTWAERGRLFRPLGG
jgi:DHA1 family bicyclomycin/chloramphenicol resistance-like MFS transporter